MKLDEVNVLVVDDQMINHELISYALRELDVRILRATSGEEALEMAANQYLGAIVLDVLLPDCSGFDIAQSLRDATLFPSVPIIFVSSYLKDLEAIKMAYKIGAIDFLVRPFEPLLLRSKIEIYVQFYKMIVALQDELARSESLVEALSVTCEELGRAASVTRANSARDIHESHTFVQQLLKANEKLLEKNQNIRAAHTNLLSGVLGRLNEQSGSGDK